MMTAKKVFGTCGVAMVTPFTENNELDIEKAVELAEYLIVEGCDSLILGGTTGESPTTTETEKLLLLKEIKQAVKDKARIIQGIGSNNTANSLSFLQKVNKVEPDGLLLVTPYYSKPSQAGIIIHHSTIAKSTDLPIMLYDIPGRAGVPLEPATIKELAKINNIKAVKEAKGDIPNATILMNETGLEYYSGDDVLNLPWLAVGAVGVVSVVGHFAPRLLRKMVDSVSEGNLQKAQEINAKLMPLSMAVSPIGGVALVKTGFYSTEKSLGKPRLPLVLSTEKNAKWVEEQLEKLKV